MAATYCSPLIATGSGSTLGYCEESCYGVIPTAPIVKTARRRSTSLGLTKETYSSEEIRNDRMTVSSRHGVRGVSGDIVTEISSGAHADFYEALLGGNWVQSAGNITLDAVPFVINAVTGVITFGPLLADPRVIFTRTGDVLRFTAVGEPYFDQQLFQVIAMNGVTSISVLPLLAPTVALPTSPITTMSAKGQPRCDMGNIYRSFTMERAFDDIGSFIAYKGVRFNSAAIDLPASGIATTTFSVMGQNANPLSSTSIDGSATLVLTDTTFGVLTGNAATKTLTATSGSFITAGVKVGDKLILDGGGSASFQNRALRTVTQVTALALTVAEAVRAGATTAAWTLTRLGTSAYDAPVNNNVMVAASGVVILGTAPVATITALSINIDNQMASTPTVGSDIVASVLWGNNCVVGGSMTLLFDRGGAGEAAYNAFVSETEDQRVVASLVNAEGTRCVSFVMTRCKFNTGDIGDAVAEGLPVTVEFSALKPVNFAAYTGASQITIIDTEVPAPAPAVTMAVTTFAAPADISTPPSSAMLSSAAPITGAGTTAKGAKEPVSA